MQKVALMLLTSACGVSAQALLAVFARRLPAPLDIRSAALSALTGPELYGAAALYAVGVASYVLLLRTYPLAQVTLTLTVLMVAMTLGYNTLLGHHLTGLQWTGAVLAGLGLLALNSA